MKVINQARVDFEYFLCNIPYVMPTTIFSNIAITYLIEYALKVEKKADKKTVCTFDIITYTITIKNISNKKVNGVEFFDTIPYGANFIINSVHINGKLKICLNPEYGITVGTIEPYESVLINFNVVVIPKICLRTITNYSELIYDYIYNVELKPAKIKIKTNCVNTQIKNNLFKYSSVTSKIIRLKFKYSSLKLIQTDVIVKNIETKVIPILPSSKESDLCKILITATLHYNIVFYKKSSNKSKREYSLELTEGFSCLMTVPLGVKYFTHHNVHISVKDCMLTPIARKRVTLNTILYIHIR
jgi:uncharacterized repeat protein (TIGR01451 family)